MMIIMNEALALDVAQEPLHEGIMPRSLKMKLKNTSTSKHT